MGNNVSVIYVRLGIENQIDVEVVIVFSLVESKKLDRFDRNLWKIGLVTIVINMLLGSLLRFGFLGILPAFIARFDFFRLHTHLGIYLGLFLPVFVYWKPKDFDLRPAYSKAYIVSYILVAMVTLTMFLLSGYSLAAKVLSGLVLLYWFVFAALLVKEILNRFSAQKLLIVVYIFVSILSIAFFVKAQISGWESPFYFRMFLSSLLFGAFFLPLLRPSKNESYAVAILGIFILLEISGYSNNIGTKLFSVLFLFYLFYRSFDYAFSKSRSEKCYRSSFFLCLIAIGLLGVLVEIIDLNRALSIVGMHFLVLGIIVPSYFFNKISILYDMSLAAMLLLMLGLIYLPQYYFISQGLLAFLGLVIAFEAGRLSQKMWHPK